MKLISIIIPYYKKKRYIKLTLQSILRQKYKNFEVLIVYDDTETEDLLFIKKLKKKTNVLNYLLTKKIWVLECQEIKE